MTTHVVCLDGTGQTRTQANPTNISLIFNAIGGAIVDAENNSFESTLIYNGVSVQVGKYLAGVGTGSIGLFDLIQQVDGEGIAEPIVRGYTFLSRNYEPGDDIITVGFSRGAAAARCLAGFVLGQGLLNPANYHPENKTSAYLRGVAAWYKYRQGQPNLAKYENLTNVFLELGEIVPVLTDTDFVPVERILAVGVFDTVSSMGLPRPATDGLDYDFVLADTVLNPKGAQWISRAVGRRGSGKFSSDLLDAATQHHPSDFPRIALRRRRRLCANRSVGPAPRMDVDQFAGSRPSLRCL